MNKTIYKQTDSRWGNKPYPVKASSFAGNGCGCVSCVHCIIEQDKYKSYTPESIRPWMIKQGYAVTNQGTTWSGIPGTLKHYGFKNIFHIDRNDPMSKAWPELNKGHRVGVILFKDGVAPNGTVWTTSGHYVAFTDYYVKDGKHYFYTKDSGGRNHDGYHTYENSMRGCISQMWIAEVPVTLLTVNGKFGTKSITALQKVLGVKQTGKIKNQEKKYKKYHAGFAAPTVGIYYGKGSSPTVVALEKMLKLKDKDGQLGPGTIKAFQKYLGMEKPNGYWDVATSKAVQEWINMKLQNKDYTPKTPTKTTTKTTTTPTNTAAAPSTTTKTAAPAKASTKGSEIAKVALSYCGNGKKPTSKYKAAAKSVYGKGNDTNCHRFVGVVLNKCGMPKMDISGKTAVAWKKILKYLKENCEEIPVNYTESQLKPGDIRVWWKGGNHYHIYIVTGKAKKAEAAHNKKYPKKCSHNPKAKHKKDWLFRVK